MKSPTSERRRERIKRVKRLFQWRPLALIEVGDAELEVLRGEARP